MELTVLAPNIRMNAQLTKPPWFLSMRLVVETPLWTLTGPYLVSCELVAGNAVRLLRRRYPLNCLGELDIEY